MEDEDVMLDLQSLCVEDLKEALEQRCLPKSGPKSILVKRLKEALMLENLQRTSTPHSGLQPNSQFEEEMSQNSFIKHYLANQQELLRQRLEREAREAAGANVGPACPKEEDNDYTEEGNSSPSNCTDKPAHSMLHLSRSTRSVTVGSPANCLKKDREKDNDEEQEATGLVICTSPGGLQRQDLNSISSELLAQRQPRVLRPLVHKMASEEPDKKRGKRELVSQTGPGEISTSEEPGDKDRRSKNVSMPVKKAILALKNQNKSIRDIAKTFDVSKSTVWYIVKKQECTVDLSNGKRPGRPQKTSVLDDQIMLGIVEDNPFSTVQQIKNTLQDVGIDVSKSTIKRRLSQHKPRGYHNMQTTESPAGPEEEDAEDHMESDSSPSYCPNKATLTQAEEGGGDGGPAVMKQGISGTVSKESSPPPVLSFPLPDTPKHSPHDMDGKSEKAGLAICPPSGGQDSESRSHSSSPEPLRHDQPGPLSLQTHKLDWV
ncbi:hypothetical protein UPYG_G00238470 [Umbra pygmaea]|uniref:SAP domain-containing protein n=1 Tax=Umbra pygmaea TaxID=75934 RepID=A0ABD0WET1_UMBPY